MAEHPAFKNVASTFAQLFDLQHDPAFKDKLTYPSPTTGDPVNVSFLIPKTVEDLERRRAGMQVWAEFSHGFLGRSGDYLNSCLSALASAKKWFEQADPIYGERIQAYYEFARENDLLATHTLIPPQVNRSVSGTEQLGGQMAARIIEERPDGIVIHGARMLATLAPIADELLVFPSTVLRGTPEDAPYSYAFAIPNDTPGLRYLCRTSLYNGGSHFDEPLASRYEEMDAVVVFDHVFVPNDRIFMLGHPELCNQFYAETGAAALMTHQVVTRTIAKTEFFLGLATEIAEAIDGELSCALPRWMQSPTSGVSCSRTGRPSTRPATGTRRSRSGSRRSSALSRRAASWLSPAKQILPVMLCQISKCICRASRSPDQSGSSCSNLRMMPPFLVSPVVKTSTSTTSLATPFGWPAPS